MIKKWDNVSYWDTILVAVSEPFKETYKSIFGKEITNTYVYVDKYSSTSLSYKHYQKINIDNLIKIDVNTD